MGVTIIAEAGVNHDGQLHKALRLCDKAIEVGADVVKFQTFNARALFKDSELANRMSKLSLSAEEFKMLARHCEKIGIEFCSTPDDVHSLKFLVEECGVKRIKLGSGSLLYEPLVDAAFDTGLPVLLSTGMATFVEAENAVSHQYQRKQWKTLPHLTVMHCVSLYPCPTELANLTAIRQFDEARAWLWPQHNYAVGHSDHTLSNDAVPAAAVGLGATVIEKHFTISNTDEGPDHQMSLMPYKFRYMCEVIREAEKALGTGVKEPSEQEAAMIPRVRKDADGFQPGL